MARLLLLCMVFIVVFLLGGLRRNLMMIEGGEVIDLLMGGEFYCRF